MIPATSADRREDRVRRWAREAVRHARSSGRSGWRAYEAAKRYLRRTHGPHVPNYDACISAICQRLNL
jgi:hypothetical protein